MIHDCIFVKKNTSKQSLFFKIACPRWIIITHKDLHHRAGLLSRWHLSSSCCSSALNFLINRLIYLLKFLNVAREGVYRRSSSSFDAPWITIEKGLVRFSIQLWRQLLRGATSNNLWSVWRKCADLGVYYLSNCGIIWGQLERHVIIHKLPLRHTW